MDSTTDPRPGQSLAQARHEADVVHRSGGVALLSLAAFWGIAAALYQWGTPTAGQVALLLGTIAAHPVAWLVLKLVGGPVLIPRANPLSGLFYQLVCVEVIAVVAGIMAAHSRPSIFFATAMLGLGAALLPMSFLYGRNLYIAVGAVFVLVPAFCAFVAEPLLPWFGLIGVVALILSGALFLRLDGGNGLPAPRRFFGERVGQGDEPELTASAGTASSGTGSEPDDDPYGLRDGSYDATATDHETDEKEQDR